MCGATAAQTFVLTNTTASQVTGLAVAIEPAGTPSNYTILGTTCGLTLNAGASCNVQVEFTPQSSGELDAALTATDEQGDTGTSEVGGTGIDYQLALATGEITQKSVIQGSAVTFNLQVIPDSTFGDTVTFVCPTEAPGKTIVNGDMPPYTTCTFSPASTAVSPGTPVPFTVTFKTTLNYLPIGPTAGIVVTHGPRSGDGHIEILTRRERLVLFPALLVVMMPWVAWLILQRAERATRLRQALVTFAFMATICCIGAMGACHKYSPNPALETTPTGTTTMNVLATTQGASRGVPVTVQVVPVP